MSDFQIIEVEGKVIDGKQVVQLSGCDWFEVISVDQAVVLMNRLQHELTMLVDS
jgi:hypothetical protein